MNTEQFIRSKFRNIISETIDERVKNIEKKLYDEVPFGGTDHFDYVEESKKQSCNECGGEMYEGECMECGWKGSGEVMELGGMDDGHPRFGNKNLSKMSRKEKEDLMFNDRDYEDYFDDDFEEVKLQPKRKFNNHDNDEHEYELEIDESECLECGSSYEMKEKLYGKQHKIDKNKNGRLDREDFKMLRKHRNEEEQLYEVEFEKQETDEGNAFTGALAKAKKQGEDSFEVDGKKYEVTEKWKGKGKAKVKESILYTESDLIDLIESIVTEEKKKFKKSEPKGYREYERAHKADKKENDDYLKSVAKKMTDYLKKSSDSGSKYEMNKTQKFPTENDGIKKGVRKKYTPSDAVDEYIDAFSYPGQTNLRFDEIKPNDKNIEKYLKGHRTTGNAQTDEDGNALGNVVPSEVGDKFYKNYEDNLYGKEQANASYKRYSQPVDIAGHENEKGSLKSKRGKKSSKSILNNLDESIVFSNSKLNEEYNRINQLIDYSRKTQ